MSASRLPVLALWITVCFYASILGVYSVLVHASSHSFGEASYFLNRIDQIALFGKVPFRDFEFAYGPLLLYVPALVHGLGAPLQISVEWSYYLSLVLFSIAGVCALFWLVDNLIPGRYYKLVVFGGLALIGLNPTMGMNYRYFRFIGPYVAILMAEETEWIAENVRFLQHREFASVLDFSRDRFGIFRGSIRAEHL